MNSDYLNTLCMACFTPLTAQGGFCPYCGYREGVQSESPHHLPVKTILAGKYLVGRVLGEGGFGITYMGYDLNLDIRVAIKEYFPTGFATRSATVSETVTPHTGDTDKIFITGRDRFVSEAKRLAGFRTLPGIVMVSDYFAENGTAYIVMEYIEGQTLKAYLAQCGGKMPAQQVFNMLAPVFGSLAMVHDNGIIHRDISPDNIMITPNGNVKLLDFGAAREFSEDGNKSLSVLLKHGYAPMEQYTTRGKQGPWTDVYALCATIYKAITGVTPEGSMDRVMNDTLAPPSRLGVAIPPVQEAALMRGLATRPEDRYQTIGELYSALTGTTPSVTPAYAQPAEAATPVGMTPPIGASPQPASGDNKSKTPIIAAAIGGFVLLALIISFALSGSGNGDSSSPGGEIRATPTGTASNSRNGSDDLTDGATPTIAPIAVPAKLSAPGTVIAVGYNDEGQCDIKDWQDVVAVSAGFSHTVGITSDGRVIATGNNESGQCNVDGWRDIVAVSAGSHHTVGITSDGTVITAGLNEDGQCDVESWHDIVAVSTGSFHTVGLNSDGTVVAAGGNGWGQSDIEHWQDIVAISAGFYHTVGLKSDGTVIATGRNEENQCNIETWRDIVAIAAGGMHTVGVKSDGTVVATGDNNYGECDVTGWQDITAVSAGFGHTVGLKPDGTLISAGSNEVGVGVINTWRDIAAISAGSLHTVAITYAEPAPNQADIGIEIGQAAPDFTLNLRGGGTVTLSDLRGSIVLLNACTTWCPPCQVEFPEIQAIHERYSGEIIVLGVSVGETVREVDDYFDGFNYNYMLAYDPDRIFDYLYNVEFIPQTWIIGADGVILDYIPSSQTFDVFDEALERILYP